MQCPHPPAARLWSKQFALTVAIFYTTAAIILSACTVFFDDKAALHGALFALFVHPFAYMAQAVGFAWKDPLGAGLVLSPVFFAFWPFFAYLLTRHAVVCRILALAQYALFVYGIARACAQEDFGAFYAAAGMGARAYFLLACAVFAVGQVYFASLLVRRALARRVPVRR